ncbi:MAG: ATP-binding cassette domain-containing protein [Myxococcota bacterium]|nr:ATP-binding cassette domain-containing protein [Myxococcota bacterium]
MTQISVRNVWQEYGDKVVLERVSFELAPHTFCTVAGPSGCGKSTFLRLLLSQETPTRGEIRIDGEPIAPEPMPDRGVVFQRYSVFPHLTVLGNVVLGLEFEGAPFTGRLFGAARRRAEEEASEVLEKVGLFAERHSRPHELSGGMRQRLSIAQTLIKRPRLLLLDEPFGALDPGTRGAMHELVTKLFEEGGMSVFMVTHDLQEAFKLGTRLLVFDKVRVDEQAPERYGANITYDIPLDSPLRRHGYVGIEDTLQKTA